MQMTDALAAHAPADAAPARSNKRRDRLIGITVMAVLPALFWTAMFALVAPVFGVAHSPTALAVIAASIAVFLASICCAVTSNVSSDEH